jgi:hypothetical protein
VKFENICHFFSTFFVFLNFCIILGISCACNDYLRVPKLTQASKQLPSDQCIGDLFSAGGEFNKNATRTQGSARGMQKRRQPYVSFARTL